MAWIRDTMDLTSGYNQVEVAENFCIVLFVLHFGAIILFVCRLDCAMVQGHFSI